MIISITGKPCSGKGTVSKLFCQKFGFECKSVGDMMRAIALEKGFKTVLDFQQNYKNMTEVDNIVDNQTAEFGKNNLSKDIVFDSRLAWFFIPKSFKVFIDVDWQTAGQRLYDAKREHEKVNTVEEAVALLKERWNAENNRYNSIYGINNLNPNNYDFVISSTNKTPEEIVDEIYKNYLEFMQKA